MNREDAKDLTLSVMVVANILLAAVCIWLHLRINGLETAVGDISERLEVHVNPPPVPEEPSLVDKAKTTYEKMKSAAKKGYEAAKEEYRKDGEK